MWTSLFAAAELETGQYRKVDVDDIELLIFNLDGEFHALEDRCTHDDAELNGGAIEDGCIKCPRHGACFDIRSGDAKSAPAYEATEHFACRVTADGIVEVDVD